MQFSSALKFTHVFRRLYAKGNSCANRYLVIYCRKNGSKRNRIGLTVGAKRETVGLYNPTAAQSR